jgi:hypothetical protein
MIDLDFLYIEGDAGMIGSKVELKLLHLRGSHRTTLHIALETIDRLTGVGNSLSSRSWVQSLTELDGFLEGETDLDSRDYKSGVRDLEVDNLVDGVWIVVRDQWGQHELSSFERHDSRRCRLAIGIRDTDLLGHELQNHSSAFEARVQNSDMLPAELREVRLETLARKQP